MGGQVVTNQQFRLVSGQGPLKKFCQKNNGTGTVMVLVHVLVCYRYRYLVVFLQIFFLIFLDVLQKDT